MANPHFNVSILSRAAGGMAVKKSAYTAKERIKDEAREKTFNYSSKADEVAYREMFIPDNAPVEFKNPKLLWNNVERFSSNPKAQLARYGSAALPKELNRQQQIELVRSFFSELKKDGMCCQVALHDSNGKNPHADFMLTMRRWDEKKGTWAAKKTSVYERDAQGHLVQNKPNKNGKMTYKKHTINNAWDDKSSVQKWRDLWEKKTNEALQKAGKAERVSLKSLAKRREEAIKKGNLDEAKRLNRQPDEHYGPRAGKGKSSPARRRNLEKEKPKMTRKELIAAKKRETFFRKKANEKAQEVQRKKFAKRYGINPDPREIGYMKRCLMEGADVKVGELPKKWNELEPKQHLEISASLKRCGIKNMDAKKRVKKECVFMYDRLHHEWCFTRDEALKSQVEAAKGVASGASKVAPVKAGKTAIAVIGNILKLPGKIPGIRKIPGIGLPGQMAKINKASKSLNIQELKNGKPPMSSDKSKTGVKDKFDALKNAKNGLESAGSQEFTPPPKKDGVLGVLKEALEETNGKLSANDISKRGGSEFSSVWMSEMAKEQWKIDHGCSIEDEWEVQGMTKWRKIRG